MSKKKNKIAPKSSEIVSPTGTAIETAEISPADSKASRIKSLLTYLKAHALMVGIIALVAFGVLGSGLKYLDEDAQREIVRRANNKSYLNKQEESYLNKVNPFLSPPDPTPTPQLSKEYIHAASRLLAVQDANAISPADLAIWRPSTGYWWVMKPDGNIQAQVGWGQNGDITVQGDYDGDGKTDFSIFRPTTSTASAVWWILKSSTQDVSYSSIPFGAVGDIPAQADFDGDGKTDIAIYRPSIGVWYIQQSSNGATIYPQFGLTGDIPTPKDFDGDGKSDLAVFRPSTNFWYIQGSTIGFGALQFGQTGDTPIPADYDGDGKADYAVRRGADWIILNLSNGQAQTITWQQAGDKEVRNDYDGDGKVDIAVWRASTGTWYIRNSSNNSTRIVQWGASGDTPVPSNYRR